MKRTAQLFKALADETRLRILALLAEGELCVCDLMAILELPQSTVSRHLAYLRHAGWVEDRRQGVWMYYRLADEGADLLLDLRQILVTHLPGHAQAEQDRRALAKFQAGKRRDACR